MGENSDQDGWKSVVVLAPDPCPLPSALTLDPSPIRWERGTGEKVKRYPRLADFMRFVLCSLHRNEQGICDLYATVRAAGIYAAVVKPASHNLSVHSCQAWL